LGGLGAGLSILGKANLRLGIRYEYFSDTIADVMPKSANLISFGIDVLGTNKMM